MTSLEEQARRKAGSAKERFLHVREDFFTDHLGGI
jgi:hypothetical protein